MKAIFDTGDNARSFMKWLMHNLADFTVTLDDSDHCWYITVTRINLLGGCVVTKKALAYGALTASKV